LRPAEAELEKPPFADRAETAAALASHAAAPLVPAHFKPPASVFDTADAFLATSFAPHAGRLFAPAKDAAAAEAAKKDAAEAAVTPNEVRRLQVSVSALAASLAALQDQSTMTSHLQRGMLDSGAAAKCLEAKVCSSILGMLANGEGLASCCEANDTCALVCVCSARVTRFRKWGGMGCLK
jgi:hypothetical protein